MLLREFYREDLDDWEASRLASLVINQVSKVDASVNNLIDYSIVYEKKYQVYEKEAKEGIDEKGPRYWDLMIDTFWHLQRNEDFEEGLRELLDDE